MAKEQPVQRPLKKSEYVIICATRQAEKGWQDLKATQRNALADTWDFLTRTPHQVTPANYPLKGELASVTRNGEAYTRWQHKPTQRGSARIWFFVDGDRVYIEDVHTAHPNETK